MDISQPAEFTGNSLAEVYTITYGNKYRRNQPTEYLQINRSNTLFKQYMYKRTIISYNSSIHTTQSTLAS